MPQRGFDLGQRREHKAAQVQTRMGQHQIGIAAGRSAVKQQVEIQSARRIAPGAAAARGALNLLQPREQNTRRQCALQLHHRIQVIALGRAAACANGRGFVNTRDAQQPQPRRLRQRPQRPAQMCRPVAEIRAERNNGPRPAPTPRRARTTPGAKHPTCSAPRRTRPARRAHSHASSMGPAPLRGSGARWARAFYTAPVPEDTAPATLPPALVTPIPGPRSLALAARLAEVESPGVTCLSPAPIFWQRAAGANVWDADGNRYVDLGGGFGVANAGHSHPRVVRAIAKQSAALLHAMGDVQPPAVKVQLLEALAARFPGGAARALLGCSGADAVEAALKTAMLASGRPGVVAFEGSYHGLSLGALDVTWRADFRAPFAARLPQRTAFARYGDAQDVLRAAQQCRNAGAEVGAVIVEPLQGRGGLRVPPAGFLAALREICDAQGWLLIADEIYTGFGRTGRWFACEHEGVVPDLLCAGKGLASGMPISACIGRAEVMAAWPKSTGEALHTQTFLGHPAGCAAALASLAAIEDEKMVQRAAETGAAALAHLRARTRGNPRVRELRGRGLMLGMECDSPQSAARACGEALRRGLILLPAGEDGRVLSLTPPLCIERGALEAALDELAGCLA